MSPLSWVLICILFLKYTRCQEEVIMGFYYPTAETANQSPDKTAPFESTDLCAAEELYYPGESGNEGICDCKPGYIFNADDEKCYPLFKQGFCSRGRHVVLGKDGFTPMCKLNICYVEKKVIFQGTCVTLGSPCDVDDRRVYGVNETTLEIACLEPFVMVRTSDLLDSNEPVKKQVTNKCSKGTKRRLKKLCT